MAARSASGHFFTPCGLRFLMKLPSARKGARSIPIGNSRKLEHRFRMIHAGIAYTLL